MAAATADGGISFADNSTPSAGIRYVAIHSPYFDAWLHLFWVISFVHSVSEMLWTKVKSEKLLNLPGIEPGSTRSGSEYQTIRPTSRCRTGGIKLMYFKRWRNELHLYSIKVSLGTGKRQIWASVAGALALLPLSAVAAATIISKPLSRCMPEGGERNWTLKTIVRVVVAIAISFLL